MKPSHLSFVLALLTASSLHAQQDGPPRGHRPPPSPVLIALDTDKDRTISAEEIAASPTSLLTLDTDSDGALSKDELRPKPPEKPADDAAATEDTDKPQGPPPEEADADRPAPPAPPVIKALDTDGDGTLSAEEIANAPASLKTLDKNSDGALTPDELHPPRPEGAGGGRGHGPEGKGPRGGRPPGPAGE